MNPNTLFLHSNSKACTTSGKKLLILYAKQPMENRGATPDIELKDNSNISRISITNCHIPADHVEEQALVERNAREKRSHGMPIVE